MAITTPSGGALAGVSTVLADGTIDGRLAADDNDVRATGYNRPEDMVLQTLADGTQLLYFATTDSDVNAIGGDGTSRVYTINLSTNEVKLFAAPQSLDLATGLAGGRRASETPTTSRSTRKATSTSSRIEAAVSDDDLWFAVDLNKDGDILDQGEGLARWASNGTSRVGVHGAVLRSGGIRIWPT